MKYSEIFYNPIVAAVRNEKDYIEALNSNASSVFLLFGDIMNVKRYSKMAIEKDKNLFIHLDFVKGLGKDQSAIAFMEKEVGCKGIISTSGSLIKCASETKLLTIQRFFLIDTLSLEHLFKNCYLANPNLIEIMPGVMPSVIKRIAAKINIPVIAGGLIQTKEDMMFALKNGAFAVSTGKSNLWNQ